MERALHHQFSSNDIGLFSQIKDSFHTLIVDVWKEPYGVAAIRRLLKMIGLFCRIMSLL